MTMDRSHKLAIRALTRDIDGVDDTDAASTEELEALGYEAGAHTSVADPGAVLRGMLKHAQDHAWGNQIAAIQAALDVLSSK